MAASQNVAQLPQLRKSELPISQINSRHGVITLAGYGIRVSVDRGHLTLEDGLGLEGRRHRVARVDHQLKRLVVIGSDGNVSLAALRWLADQNVSFVMLERSGSVLLSTGPVRPSDVRLRRAQALAHQTEAGFRISRELIDRKLAGQDRVVRTLLKDQAASVLITQIRSELAEVESIDAIRLVESRAAKVYWRAWRTVPIKFPTKDLPRVPEHWRRFDARASGLTGSPRLATNPVNAMLNYLYALLEAESRLALATLGLDPGMGFLHLDTSIRDSLACDLMEPIRAEVDAYVLSWVLRQPLKRSWFFEERNGNCRLMSELASQLSETTSTWARFAAPLAEWMAKEIAKTSSGRTLKVASRLTQSHKRALTGRAFTAPKTNANRQSNVCNDCGKVIRGHNEKCRSCVAAPTTERLKSVAVAGREISHTEAAEAKRSMTRKANHAVIKNWSVADLPQWLTKDFYLRNVKPRLVLVPTSAIVQQLTVSRGYANEVRKGRLPHPRHWQTLARLGGLPS